MSPLLRYSRLFAFALCWMFLVCPAFAARVALIVADENLESVLTSELSKQPGLELVERASLSSLARESALTGNLSHLKGAEIVAIGEKHPGGGFAVRLAEPASGATVQTFVTPPGLDTPATAGWLARRLAPWLRKSPSAVQRRFSLIGLRCEVDSEANRQMERGANLALAAALQASPDALVLERWKLNDLLFEKELAGRGDEPFWSAAQLIDGSLSEKDGRLHARMRMRSGGKETLAEADGPAGDLPGLAAKLAAQALNTDTSANPPREAEATAFVNEAAWLLKHGLKKEAAQAAETAIALGDQKQTTETLRIRAYAEAAYPENLDPNLRQEADSAYEKSDLPSEKVPESVALATTVASLSEAYARKYAAMPRGRNVIYEHPTVFSVRTLPFVFSVLRSAHKHGYHLSHPEAVKTLRSELQRLLAAVEALPLADKREWLDARGTVLRHLIVFAPYWNDTPEETLQFLEKVLSLDFDKECHEGALLARRNLSPIGFSPPAIPMGLTKERKWTSPPLPCAPRLINWRDPQDRRLDAMWRDYVQKKLASPDALIQADGLAFLWSSQPTYDERKALTPRYVDFLEKYSGELYGLRGQVMWQQIREGITQECQWIGKNENRLRTLAVFEKLLNGSQPLAPGVVGSMTLCVPAEAVKRVKVEEGQRLLTALATYTDTLGPAATEKDLREIRSTRNAVLRLFPQLAPQPPADALPVTRAWIVSERTPQEFRGKGRFDADSGVWHDGRLWFLDAADRKIWRVDPTTLATEVFAPDNRPAESQAHAPITRGSNLNRLYKRPVLASGKLYLPEQEDIWVYHIAKNSWAALSLPKARYMLWSVGNRIFASFGERGEGGRVSSGDGSGLYEIDPARDTARLIFNSRRRPPEHALDGIADRGAFCLLPSAAGGVVAGLLKPFGFYNIESGKPETLAISQNRLSNVVSQAGDTLFSHTAHQKNQSLCDIQRMSPQGKLETLLWNPAGEAPKPPPPVWKFPASLPDPATLPGSIEYRAAMRGDDLVLLVYQYGNTPWGAGLADLYLFRRGKAEATRIPLAFRLSPAADATLKRYHHGSETFAYPLVDHYGLISTDQGLALTGYAMPGFWFIPWADIDAREKTGR